MRVRASVKRLCEACRVVKRRGKIFIVCKDNKKHKQRQGLHTLAPAVGSNASFMDPGASIGVRLWLQSQ